MLLFKSYISELFHLDHPNLLYLLPLLVWLMSGTEILVNWRNRAKDYNTISTNRIISSATNVSYKFGHPLQLYISSNGLVLGTILGQLIAFFHIIRKLQFSIISTSKEALKAVATKYKSFALFSTPAALVNILAVNMPWFMIAAFDGQSATGQFGNAYKLTYLPISMLGMALGQVFFEQISRLKTDKTESASVSHELVNLMFTAALIPVIVLAVWGDIIAPWLLGDTWQEAGVYIQITILFYFSMFLTSSFSSAFSTYGKLSQQLVYNVTFLIGTSAALYFGYTIGGDTRTALLWFAIVGTTLRLFILNYFFVLFGKNLIAKTIFAIILVALLLWLGFGIKDGF